MSNNRDMNDFYISRDIIEAIMKDLALTNTAGPEGIPSILLNKCALTRASPVTLLWQKSLEAGYDPIQLKEVFVIPQLKPGANKSNPASFRPISQTSELSKDFERFLKRILMEHLESNDLLRKFQHGFRTHRSCLTQMLMYYDKILGHVEMGQNVDSVYLDFEKAFDHVDWGVLAHRLVEKIIWGKVGLWLFDFLQNHTQRILANNKMSKISKITSGIPQGTVLGPILFLILIDFIGM